MLQNVYFVRFVCTGQPVMCGLWVLYKLATVKAVAHSGMIYVGLAWTEILYNATVYRLVTPGTQLTGSVDWTSACSCIRRSKILRKKIPQNSRSYHIAYPVQLYAY